MATGTQQSKSYVHDRFSSSVVLELHNITHSKSVVNSFNYIKLH